MRKSVIALLISVLVFSATTALYYSDSIERLEFFFFDSMVKLTRQDKRPSDKIKVILIDEASLKAMEGIAGRWPWPRAIWADLLEFLSMGGARAVLFDVLFTERQAGYNDKALVEATKTSGNVYHSMMILREPEGESPELGRPMPEEFVKKFSIKKISGAVDSEPGTMKDNNFYLPFKDLYDVSKGTSVVEFTPDSDGSFRRTKPLREYGGGYFSVLGIAPFIDAASEVSIGKGSITIGGSAMPVDEKGNYIINMYGKVEAYSIGGIFASLQRIREGDIEGLVVDPVEFKDVIVYIGGSAVGVEDLKATSIQPRMPGVLLHQAIASNYLMNDFMKPPDRTLTMLSALIGAFLTTYMVLFLKSFSLRSVFPIAMLALYSACCLFAFKSDYVVELVPFSLATVSGSFLSFGYLTFTEAKEKRKVAQLFSQYVSKDVLDEIMRHRKDFMNTAGSKAEVSVLFTDIRGFTTFSENTPPDRVVEMLNCFFSKMAEIILANKGTLDKYIGDAIMAFWGAPVPDKDHALNAVTAAIEMLEALDDVNADLKQRGYENFTLRIGIGINSGSVTIGSIGSEKKLNYTIVGDAVNLSSRLESMTKEHNTGLIISEYTYERVKDKIHCLELGNVKVKGREKPVRIYTPDTQKTAAEGGKA
ncbi:MAG: adenylate/guanylate cyclase domain-containing protein [Thermodesulfovibrionales bacterium]|nr:adenylate/guanylate cyclase domain-containing protein [Thermodesulfovibrionales bacterium]